MRETFDNLCSGNQTSHIWFSQFSLMGIYLLQFVNLCCDSQPAIIDFLTLFLWRYVWESFRPFIFLKALRPRVIFRVDSRRTYQWHFWHFTIGECQWAIIDSRHLILWGYFYSVGIYSRNFDQLLLWRPSGHFWLSKLVPMGIHSWNFDLLYLCRPSGHIWLSESVPMGLYPGNFHKLYLWRPSGHIWFSELVPRGIYLRNFDQLYLCRPSGH